MKRWKLPVLFLLLFAVLSSGCTVETQTEIKEKTTENAEKNVYWLYEINDNETELIKKQYEPKDESTEEMLKEIESMMAKKEDSDAVLNLLTDDVTLLNHSLAGNVLTLNFNEGYMELSAVREILVRDALVKNFIQVPDISAVQIQVDGQPLKDNKGCEIGLMTANTFVENFGKDAESYRYVSMKLYFSNEDGTELVPEERNVYYMSNLPLEKVVLEQLMNGPTAEGCYAAFSSKVKILNVVNSDGDCYINLGESFISDALSVHPEITIYSIVNSIIENCGVQRVQISVGGESDQTFREIMDLNRFYEWNEQLIQTTEAETAEKAEEK